MEVFIALVLVTGVVAVVVWPRPDFVIQVGRQGVRVRGRVPQAQQSKIADFLREDVGQRGPLKVSGKRMADGMLRLSIRGVPSEGDRQRIRNFFVNEVRWD